MSKSAGYKPADEMFEEANRYYFTSEVVNSIRNDLVDRDKTYRLLDVLEEAKKELPNNPDVLGILASEYAFLKEYDKADNLFVRAINNSHVYVDKQYYIKKYGKEVLYPTYRAPEAVKLFQNLQKNYKGKSRKLRQVLAESYLYAGDYIKAKRELDKLKFSMKMIVRGFRQILKRLLVIT